MGKSELFAYAGKAVLLALLSVALPASTSEAASLWQKAEAGGQPAGWYADPRPRQPGDLLTLVIVEETSASQRAESSNSQDGGAQVGGLGLLLKYIPLVGLGGKDYNEGQGETARVGSLTARLTVQVVEVTPTGVLRIEGRQTIIVNGEKQELKVSGLVRSQDVQPDNTVLSTYVADAEIVLSGEGMLNEKQEPGLLTKALNWLF